MRRRSGGTFPSAQEVVLSSASPAGLCEGGSVIKVPQAAGSQGLKERTLPAPLLAAPAPAPSPSLHTQGLGLLLGLFEAQGPEGPPCPAPWGS